MSVRSDIEADLVIALQTLDTSSFREILKTSPPDVSGLQDQNKLNIFHEFSKCLIGEKLLSEFLEITLSFFYKCCGESAPYKIKSLMNSQTIEEKFTPLHFAVSTGKLVIFHSEISKRVHPPWCRHAAENLQGSRPDSFGRYAGVNADVIFFEVRIEHEYQRS